MHYFWEIFQMFMISGITTVKVGNKNKKERNKNCTKSHKLCDKMHFLCVHTRTQVCDPLYDIFVWEKNCLVCCAFSLLVQVYMNGCGKLWDKNREEVLVKEREGRKRFLYTGECPLTAKVEMFSNGQFKSVSGAPRKFNGCFWY